MSDALNTALDSLVNKKASWNRVLDDLIGAGWSLGSATEIVESLNEMIRFYRDGGNAPSR